jgi:Domain of unknown function (DUF4936)
MTDHPGAVLYVYYKLGLAQHAEWAPRVRQFQAALVAQWPGLVAELLQRPEPSAGLETWMETYHHRSGLTANMADHIAQAAVQAQLPAPRHTEIFMPLR